MMMLALCLALGGYSRGGGSAPSSALQMEDGSSYVLMEDGSKLVLE